MEENESIRLNENSLIFSSILIEMGTSRFDSIQIICKDGKYINVSCVLLVSISPFLADLLKHADTQDYVIVLPDIEISTVISLINNLICVNPEDKKIDKEIWSLYGIFWKKGYLSKHCQLSNWDTDAGHTRNNEAISELDINNEDHTNSYSSINDRYDSFEELDLKTEVLDGELFNDLEFLGKNEPIVIKDCFVNIKRFSRGKIFEYTRKTKANPCPTNKTSSKARLKRLTEQDPTYNPEDQPLSYSKKKKLKNDKLSSSPETPKRKRKYISQDYLSFQPAMEKSLLKRLKKKDIPLSKNEIGRVFSVAENSFDEGFNIKQEELKRNLQESNNFEDPRTTWCKIHEINPKVYFITSFNIRPQMVCPLCLFHFPGNKMTTGKLFFTHLRRHKLKNTRCTCMLTKGAVISDHIRLDHWNWVRCQHCDFIVEPNYLSIHTFKSHLEDEKKTLHCDLCQIQQKRVHRYQIHMDHHLKPKDPSACNICNIRYKSRAHWRHHEQVQHLKERRGCDQCFFTCKTDKQMQDHIEIRHNKPKVEKKFICDICAFTTTSQNKIDAHKLTMHDPDLVPCPICQKMKSKFSLDYHMKRIHVEHTVCTICGAKVKNINVHMAQHLPYEQSKFKCEPCKKGFSDSNRLKNHMMNVHLKERPFKCRYDYGCEFAYNDVSNRNSHERKKHGQLFTKEEPTQI